MNKLQSAKDRWAAAAGDQALRGSPTWEMQHAEREALRGQTSDPQHPVQESADEPE